MKNRCHERVYRNHKWYQCKLPGKNLKLTNNTICVCNVLHGIVLTVRIMLVVPFHFQVLQRRIVSGWCGYI